MDGPRRRSIRQDVAYLRQPLCLVGNYALTGYAHSFRELIVLRSLMGISEACYLPAGLALIATFHSERTRSRVISIHYSGTYIGTVLGGVLGGWAGVHYGWRPVFLVFGIVGCAQGVLLITILREPSQETEKSV
jgi:MFS family permease